MLNTDQGINPSITTKPQNDKTKKKRTTAETGSFDDGLCIAHDMKKEWSKAIHLPQDVTVCHRLHTFVMSATSIGRAIGMRAWMGIRMREG